MRSLTAVVIASVVGLLAARTVSAKAVETFQIVVGNETHVADGSEVLYLENLVWLQKSWKSFSRTKHTIFAGTEMLAEPMLHGYTGTTRYGVDTAAVFVGYKARTYLPDWYNFNIKLRIPIWVPADPHGRARCDEEPLPTPGDRWEAVTPQQCASYREFTDRLELRSDPLLVKKTWNLFTVYDRNRITASLHTIEYSNKLKLITTTPDLEFPIAMYIGDEIRFRKNLTEPGGRVRNDLIVGLASNFFDWLHLGIEMMYHLDTKSSANGAFIAELYLEFYFDIFFDNTVGDADTATMAVYEEARD